MDINVLLVQDNFSAHMVSTEHFTNFVNLILPPNMICTLRPAYASTGLSCKAAHRRCLINHIRRCVNNLVENGGQSKFSTTKAKSIYYSV